MGSSRATLVIAGSFHWEVCLRLVAKVRPAMRNLEEGLAHVLLGLRGLCLLKAGDGKVPDIVLAALSERHAL